MSWICKKCKKKNKDTALVCDGSVVVPGVGHILVRSQCSTIKPGASEADALAYLEERSRVYPGTRNSEEQPLFIHADDGEGRENIARATLKLENANIVAAGLDLAFDVEFKGEWASMSSLEKLGLTERKLTANFETYKKGVSYGVKITDRKVSLDVVSKQRILGATYNGTVLLSSHSNGGSEVKYPIKKRTYYKKGTSSVVPIDASAALKTRSFKGGEFALLLRELTASMTPPPVRIDVLACGVGATTFLEEFRAQDPQNIPLSGPRHYVSRTGGTISLNSPDSDFAILADAFALGFNQDLYTKLFSNRTALKYV